MTMAKPTIATLDTKLDILMESTEKQGSDIQDLMTATTELTAAQKTANGMIARHDKALFHEKTGLATRMIQSEGTIKFAVKAFWTIISAGFIAAISTIIGTVQYIRSHIGGP